MMKIDALRPNRRSVLAGISTLAAATAAPQVASAAWDTAVIHAEGNEPGIQQWERRLAVMNRNTGESINDIYWQDGSFVPETLERINWVMRDHNNDQTGEISTHLLNLLNRIRVTLDTDAAFEITSGFRSLETNRRLMRESGAARNSLHLNGLAADCRLQGYSLSGLSKCAKSLKQGGVGSYSRRSTVHIDVGPVRSWRG